MVDTKFKEIFRLKDMLDDEEIPYVYHNRSNQYAEHYQIGYPVLPPSDACVCSIIEGNFTYGQESDLLEIMGLLEEDEAVLDAVVGGLSADEVLSRIKADWVKRKHELGDM